MTVEKLNRAIGDIDKFFVAEAETYFSTQVGRRRTKARVLVLVAAILVAVLVVGCVTISLFEMDETLKEWLGLEGEINSDLREGGVDINETVTAGGVTVTVDQLFGDPHSLYILLHVTVAEWVPLTEDENIRALGAYGDFLHITISGTGTMGGGYGWRCVEIDEETRTKTYILSISSTPDDLINRKITLSLDYEWHRTENIMESHFGNSTSDGQRVPLEISFYTKYHDMTKTFRIGESYGDYHVKELRISPVSSIIRISGLPDDQHFLKGGVLTMADGTEIDLLYSVKLKQIWWNDSIDIYFENSQIVDLKDVVSVSFTVDGETFYTVMLP